MSTGTTLYLLLEQNTEVSTRDVRLSDVAKMACTDEHALNRLKTIKLFRIPSGKKFRKTMTVVDIIEKVQALYPNMEVNNLGETDFIVTYVEQGKEHPVWDFVKTVLISAVIFFGSAFSIMAFNNDINVTELFAQVYEQCTGAVSDGYTILEISYSLGLSVGIILFFNHFAGKKITMDPTPLEVQMKQYEQDVNTAIIQENSRKGKGAGHGMDDSAGD